MLIETISFEIRDFNSGIAKEYLVENTADNYALIAANRFTRAIQFTKTFDFEFAHKRNAPKFIEFAEAVFEAEFWGPTEAEELGIDELDEMVGSF